MAVILIIIAILFLVLLGWSWNSLGSIDKKEKIKYIIIGLVLTYLLTFIIYAISKIGIQYDNKETMKIIRTVFVLLFAIVNGYILLPYSFKKIEKIKSKEIEEEKLKRSIIILLIIIVTLLIFESIYLGNLQQGILKMRKF
mgnify:FL=1